VREALPDHVVVRARGADLRDHGPGVRHGGAQAVGEGVVRDLPGVVGAELERSLAQPGGTGTPSRYWALNSKPAVSRLASSANRSTPWTCAVSAALTMAAKPPVRWP
jgi:hypothetical protein